MLQSFQIQEGNPRPFGVFRHNQWTNFSIFSKNAVQVWLQIYLEPIGDPVFIVELDANLHKTGDIWHLQLKNLPELFYYSYRMSGPNCLKKGHQFQDRLELVDPYAENISSLGKWNDRDNREKQLGYFIENNFNWEGDRPINRPLDETIIYELHVRGFSRHPSSGAEQMGTYKGIIEKIEHLKELGITAIELLPVHEFDETDCRYVNPTTNSDLLNYWGYSSINFFALKSAYASSKRPGAAVLEFKEMVKALHKAGIEVILDVVFNHTAEGDRTCSVINFKGIENSVYYLLDETGDYRNYSGCGNTMNCNHPVVRKMILDSLHYFVINLHVDGFRFDLASILTRDEDGNVMPDPPLLEAIAKDPILSKTKIIAEAWDASGLYQVGSFPASKRWAEWNGRYRDLIRRFSRGDTGLIGELATRISGSEDLYKHSERNPFHSINFVTAHDGFSMMDLVSYNQKHNLENGENGEDGCSENFSYNFGIEGETSDISINSRRFQQIRNLATLLMISQGTPMVLAGDEFGNTQKGNNNAWCQDNEISWLNWTLLQQNRELFDFWKALIKFRKQHEGLRRDRFFTGEKNEISGLPDISWHNERLFEPDFSSSKRTLAFLIDGMIGEQEIDDTLYIAMNFDEVAKSFEVPARKTGNEWIQVLDTADPLDFIQNNQKPPDIINGRVSVTPFSIRILRSKVE